MIFSHRKEIGVGIRISAQHLPLTICISFKHTRVRCEDGQICEHRYLLCYKYANVLLNDYTEARKIRAATSTPHSSATYQEAVVLAKSGECFYKTLAENLIYLHTMTSAKYIIRGDKTKGNAAKRPLLGPFCPHQTYWPTLSLVGIGLLNNFKEVKEIRSKIIQNCFYFLYLT